MFIIFRFDGSRTRASKHNIFVYTEKTRITDYIFSFIRVHDTPGAPRTSRIEIEAIHDFLSGRECLDPARAAPRKCVCVLNQHLYGLDVSPRLDLLR